jgi:hypothetical protein
VRKLLAADLENERNGICLFELFQRHLADPETMRSLRSVAVDGWPESGYVGRPATRWLAMLDDVGTPFGELLPGGMREPSRGGAGRRRGLRGRAGLDGARAPHANWGPVAEGTRHAARINRRRSGKELIDARSERSRSGYVLT